MQAYQSIKNFRKIIQKLVEVKEGEEVLREE